MTKTTLETLAFFGGQAMFSEEIPVGQVNLPDWDAFEKMFSEIFERGYYTNHGPLVAELEDAVAARLGVRHAICVTNGTIALMVAARALGLRGEVIVPAFTFPGTVQALSWAGLTPVFADVDIDTHTLTAATVEPRIGPQTCAVLGVHLWGSPCDPERLQALCDHHALALFFDAAHAFGCAYDGGMIGRLGKVETFSFHATKIISGAEGGCLTTDDDDLARRIRTVRNFHQSESALPVDLRINGKMSEAQAAMALLSLQAYDAHRDHNRMIDGIYRQRAQGWRGIRLLDFARGREHNHQYAVLETDADAFAPGRDALVELLRAENILARRYFHPGAHRLTPYAETCPPTHLPVTEALCDTILQIPLGPCVSDTSAHRICDLIDLISAKGPEIAARMREQAAPRGTEQT